MAEGEEKPEERIKTIEEYHERTPRRWPLLAAYVIGTIIIVLIIVFGARAIYHHYHKPAVKTVPANTKELPQQPPAGANNNKKKSSTAANNLPNSGPGQVVAIFLGSSAAAAGAHFALNLHRQKAN